MMEEFLIAAVEYLRLSVEAVCAAVIGVGAVSTVFRYALSLLGLRKYSNVDIRLHLGQFLAGARVPACSRHPRYGGSPYLPRGPVARGHRGDSGSAQLLPLERA